MVGTLILTHGGLARELLASAEVIAGELPGFEALSLDWGEGVEEARRKILAAVHRLDRGDGVIILTDMFGGTPCNLAQQLAELGRVEVLTGVNLPMVLRLGCRTGGGCDSMKLGELVAWLQDKGRNSVRKAQPIQPVESGRRGIDGASR